MPSPCLNPYSTVVGARGFRREPAGAGGGEWPRTQSPSPTGLVSSDAAARLLFPAAAARLFPPKAAGPEGMKSPRP